MSEKSAIEWLDGGATWNPTRGCTPCAPECQRCYARTFAERWRGIPGHPYQQGFDPRLVESALDLPLRWKEPRLVFVNSMSDLFHEAFPFHFIGGVFYRMQQARQHQFIVLTKRIHRALEFFKSGSGHIWATVDGEREPVPNVMIGVSVGTRARRGDIDVLREVPAATRMLSAEPLLEDLGAVDLSGIDFCAMGGESGPKARPCNVAWIRSLLARCRKFGTRPFVKQLGANIEDRNDAGFDGIDNDWPKHIAEEDRVEDDPSDTGYQGAPVRVRTRHRKGADMSEWPEDLRVREMPR